MFGGEVVKFGYAVFAVFFYVVLEAVDQAFDVSVFGPVVRLVVRTLVKARLSKAQGVSIGQSISWEYLKKCRGRRTM